MLTAKAPAEPAFRQALLKNPKAAVEKEFGVALPAGRKLKVVEENATTNYLVLPATSSDELSEAELEAVAGGWLALFGPMLAAAAAKSSGDQSRSDIGQKLQFQLNEANSIYTR